MDRCGQGEVAPWPRGMFCWTVNGNGTEGHGDFQTLCAQPPGPKSPLASDVILGSKTHWSPYSWVPRTSRDRGKGPLLGPGLHPACPRAPTAPGVLLSPQVLRAGLAAPPEAQPPECHGQAPPSLPPDPQPLTALGSPSKAPQGASFFRSPVLSPGPGGRCVPVRPGARLEGTVGAPGERSGQRQCWAPVPPASADPPVSLRHHISST